MLHWPPHQLLCARALAMHLHATGSMRLARLTTLRCIPAGGSLQPETPHLKLPRMQRQMLHPLTPSRTLPLNPPPLEMSRTSLQRQMNSIARLQSSQKLALPSSLSLTPKLLWRLSMTRRMKMRMRTRKKRRMSLQRYSRTEQFRRKLHIPCRLCHVQCKPRDCCYSSEYRSPNPTASAETQRCTCNPRLLPCQQGQTRCFP